MPVSSLFLFLGIMCLPYSLPKDLLTGHITNGNICDVIVCRVAVNLVLGKMILVQVMH